MALSLTGNITHSTAADGTFSAGGTVAWNASHTNGLSITGTLAASDVTGLAAVATSGAYADLSGTPTIATLKTNGTTNGSQAILNLKNGSNVTVTDDGVGGITIASSLGATSWTRVTKTHADTPYTIPAAYTIVVADTSGGVLTVNLPTTPADADIVAVKRSTTDQNALTIGRNSLKIEGASANYTALAGLLYAYVFQYDSNAGSWWIV